MNKDLYNRIVPFVKNHIKILAPVCLIAVTAVVTYIALSARGRNVPDEVPVQPVATVSVVEGEVQPVEEQPIVLAENTDSALADFFAGYYLCLSNGDVDTLTTLIDQLETYDKLLKAEQSQYLDYEIEGIYCLPGYDPSRLIVFVVTNVTFDRYPDNKLPSYDGFLVSKNEDGSFMIVNSEPSYEENEYIAKCLACDDVIELGNRITTDYNDKITASPELLTYMKELDSVVSTEAGEKLAALNSGEEIQMPEIEQSDVSGNDEPEIQMATANQTVNVRVSDSMNADTMGQLRGGQSVEVVEIKGNGWSQINFEGKTGYVKSEYLTLDIDISTVVTIGTVTATETLNIRASASTDGMVMGSFAKGTTARLVSEKDGWCEVVYNNKVVYLSSQYLEIEYD
ncbi:MAG: SH3 domain-containing protein [Lachnospiraceae bacterium]|nr:SH3 domain-containing protein [Lachnospiraceae bacterium]